MDVSKRLKEFGLNDKQITIYRSLLKSGPSTIVNLSNRLKLNRTTVHLLVKELLDRHILVEVIDKKRRFVKAESPEIFKTFLIQQHATINKKLTDFPNFVELMYKDINFVKENTSIEVKHYVTLESINWLYDEILKSPEVLSYVNASEIIKFFPHNGERFLNAVKRGAKIWDMHLYNSSIEPPFDRLGDFYSNFKLKRLPPSVHFDSMDCLIYENKVAIILGTPTPHAIVIENAHYYQMSKALFEWNWSHAHDINSNK